MLANIEFYNTPDGDVIIKEVNQPARRLKEEDRELISPMLTIISDRYPKAYAALMELYSKRTMNKTFFEYSVVHRFCRCNSVSYTHLTLPTT